MNEEYYTCKICGRDFDTYDECYSHVERCVDIEDNIEFKTRLKCKYCEKIYYQETHALGCEQKHEFQNDKYYQDFVFIDTKRALQIAAQHPNQKRLNEVQK